MVGLLALNLKERKLVPVTKAVPSRMIPQPATLLTVMVSPRNSAPLVTPKIGVRKVTVNVLVAPMSTSKRKYRI